MADYMCPRYEDYTIGIICALGYEMNAVRHALDREHANLPIKPNDSNIYILGELNRHNVAIACLPGSQGKSSAAVAATNMARTFPLVRYRFLVGIGGGAPSENNDNRLGDVVVSMASDQHGGILQYDYGKDPESGFTRKTFTGSPPAALRAAVYKMQSDHLSRGSHISDYLQRLIFQLNSGYQRPSEEDILFQADYPHTPDQQSCRQCDRTRRLQRSPRPDDDPRIFYGLIASVDRVIKSAAKRIAISNDLGGDVLCFEMEAAGLMTEFPCVAIPHRILYDLSLGLEDWSKVELLWCGLGLAQSFQ